MLNKSKRQVTSPHGKADAPVDAKVALDWAVPQNLKKGFRMLTLVKWVRSYHGKIVKWKENELMTGPIMKKEWRKTSRYSILIGAV